MSEELDISFLLQVAQDPDVSTRIELSRQTVSFLDDPDADPRDRAMLTPVLMALANDSVVSVRKSIAAALARSPHAPQSVVRTLVSDVDDICLPLLKHTQALPENDLMAIVAAGAHTRQLAIAARSDITPRLARMLVETASPELCLQLLENPEFKPGGDLLERAVELFADHVAVIEAISDRPDVPLHVRILLISSASHNLSSVQSLQGFLNLGQEDAILNDAREQAIIRLICDMPGDARDIHHTVRVLDATDSLTASLIMRASIAGLIQFVEAALQALTGIPEKRVRSLLRGRARLGSRAIYMRAGLPLKAYRIFRFSLDIFEERQYGQAVTSAEEFSKLVVERVVTDGDDLSIDERRTLLALLARLAGDEARGIARQLCESMPLAA